MTTAHDQVLKVIEDASALADTVRGFQGNVSALRVPLLNEHFSARQRGVLEKHFSATASNHLKDSQTSPETHGQALETLVDHAFFDPIAKDAQWAQISDVLLKTNSGKDKTLPENAELRLTAQKMMIAASYRLQYHLEEIVNNYPMILPDMPDRHPVARIMDAYKTKFLPELRALMVELKRESGLPEADVAQIYLEAANNDGSERMTLIDPAEWPKKRGHSGPTFS